jgi:hypothetical protein
MARKAKEVVAMREDCAKLAQLMDKLLPVYQ